MGFLIFRRINGPYRKWKKNDDSLDSLGWFLTDSTGGVSAFEHVDNLELEELVGNSYYLIFSQDKVTIGILFCEDNPQEIVIKRDNLRDIIKTWGRLTEQNVEEIVMRNDGYTVSMMGRSLTAKERELHQQSLEALSKLSSIEVLASNQHLVKEFEDKWRRITPDEARELEREFYTRAINDDSILWAAEEQ